MVKFQYVNKKQILYCLFTSNLGFTANEHVRSYFSKFQNFVFFCDYELSENTFRETCFGKFREKKAKLV